MYGVVSCTTHSIAAVLQQQKKGAIVIGVTLSYLSALDVVRILRANGVNIRGLEPIRLVNPLPWVGERWVPSTFADSRWQWSVPSKNNHLHVMVPDHAHRIQMENVESRVQLAGMPAGSVLWLDECSSVVCPELLFLQMAKVLSLPALVMLGYEFCGHFSRDAWEPIEGPIKMELPSATSVDSIQKYISTLRHVPGIAKAKKALQFIADHAMSAPEALLAAVYSLPSSECGYGLGPIILNERIPTLVSTAADAKRNRYPDLLFSFAPLGINYEGENHLDLKGLLKLLRQIIFCGEEDRAALIAKLDDKMKEVRQKYVDDIVRNRQLMAEGRIVLPVTKEDLYKADFLDDLTWSILACAQNIFGIDTTAYERTLENTELARDRNEFIASFLPGRGRRTSSHGKA